MKPRTEAFRQFQYPTVPLHEVAEELADADAAALAAYIPRQGQSGSGGGRPR